MQSSRKKILSFDLDMTLFDDASGAIPQSALDAINSVRDRYYIIFSTGRNLSQKINRHFIDTVKPDAYVHSNGAQVHIDHKLVYQHLFEKEQLARILEFAYAHELCICSLVDNVQYSTNPQKLEELLPVLHGKNMPQLGDPRELLSKSVMTLGLAGNKDEATLFRSAFPDLKTTLVIGDAWYDIMEPTVSKAHGVQIVLDHFGLTMDDVIAFGDSMNDYELLKTAGTAVAMGNAVSEIKAIADFVTDDIDKNGIANAIQALC